MKICMPHWTSMREAVAARGMDALVPDSGEEAAHRLDRSIVGGEDSPDTFDPLMWMHMAVWARATETLRIVGADPMILLMELPPDDVGGDVAFVEAMQCPICCLNVLSYDHDLHCTAERCNKPPGLTFDDWIDSCADAAREHYEKLIA